VTLPASAVDHYRLQQRISVGAAEEVSRIFRAGMGENFDLGWNRVAAQIFAVVIAAQAQAAASGLAYVPQVLAEQGIDGSSLADVDPARFAGGTSEGAPVEYVLGYAPVKAKQTMAVVQSSALAIQATGDFLTAFVLDAVRDANRDATQAGMVVRPAVHEWVRMLNPPSCKRCVILAGKTFRWNEGFQRHPRCDCRHIPTAENRSDDVRVDPYRYFGSLPAAEQNRLFGAADAQAIRDGADIYRVANVRMRGLSKTRGRQGWQARRYGTPSKMTIDDINAAAGGDRTRAVELMRENGFILDAGQVAGGSILGNAPGGAFGDLAAGALGRGGTRKGATLAYRKAVASGARDPLEPATQTAAERRLHSAFLMKQAADRGSNPFAANSQRNPLTPEIRALVERNFRRQIEELKNAPEQVRALARLLGIL
jgi:hypothetical protein